jgi:hypothetical protein
VSEVKLMDGRAHCLDSVSEWSQYLGKRGEDGTTWEGKKWGEIPGMMASHTIWEWQHTTAGREQSVFDNELPVEPSP